MVLTTGALLAAGAVSALSAGASAYKRGQAADAQNAFLEWAKANNRSRYYEDPTIGERALLKTARQDRQDSNDAINNMLVAGGATMENALAARKASNERFDRFNSQLLAANDAKRARLDDQLVGLNQQQANMRANNYLQSAQDWNQWGQQTAGAILSYGSTGLLGGDQLSAAEWAKSAPAGDVLGAMAQRVDNEDLMTPVIGSAPNLNTPGVTGPSLGGLKGVNR